MDYEPFVTRILEILRNNAAFAAEIREFRFGDLGDNRDNIINASAYPLCYVTTATNPEVSRVSMFPTGDTGRIPGQKRIYEFWVIIVTKTGKPELSQRNLYKLTGMVLDTLEKNQQLRNTRNENPLCAASDIFTQRRLETHRGQLVEAMTIRVRPMVFLAA